MRVLGIDPGTRFMGYGVVEERRGQLVHIAHGVIRTDPQAALELRLGQLFAELSRCVSLHKPTQVAVEGVFAFRNPRSALILGHARGVALLVAAQNGLPVSEYAPARIKKAVGAGGAASKESVLRMVNLILGDRPVERLDASDALAVALCHLSALRAPTARKPAPKRERRGFESLAALLKPAYVRYGVG